VDTLHLAAILTTLLVLGPVLHAQSTQLSEQIKNNKEKQPSHLHATAVVDKQANDSSQRIKILIDIDNGWFIYANPVGVKSIEPNQLSITTEDRVEQARVSVKYPVGIQVDDPIVGKWRKYEGKIVVLLTVTDNRNERTDLHGVKVRVRFSISDGRTCGPLQSIIVKAK
jgi:hypothetical protein